MKRILLAPSLLSADMANLATAVAIVAREADLIHCDVMDGHFVPNLTFGAPVVAAVKRISTLPLDVHLMIESPSKWIESYARAGLGSDDFLSFHIEAEPDPAAVLKRIRQLGIRPALAVKPGTSIEGALELAGLCDQILVMTVEPGFGGQSFMKDMMGKIKAIRQRVGDSIIIGVDGGIDPMTAPLCSQAGADLFVAGKAVYGQPDPAEALRQIRHSLE